MLQVVAHSENASAEDIDGKGAQWKGRDSCVEVFGGVKPQQAADGCEHEGEGCAWSPVSLWWERGEENGTEPAAEGEDNGERVEESSRDFEGETWDYGCGEEGKMCANVESGERDGGLYDDDGEEGHEAVATVAGGDRC